MMALECGGTVIAVSRRDTVHAGGAAQRVGIVTGVLDGGVPYEGPYEVTPAAQPQTLGVQGMTMSENLTVGAIPNNYGLITWDGSVITVS